jgi:hypothetical protein
VGAIGPHQVGGLEGASGTDHLPAIALKLDAHHRGGVLNLGPLGLGLVDQKLIEAIAAHHPDRVMGGEGSLHRIPQLPGVANLPALAVNHWGKVKIKVGSDIWRKRSAAGFVAR